MMLKTTGMVKPKHLERQLSTALLTTLRSIPFVRHAQIQEPTGGPTTAYAPDCVVDFDLRNEERWRLLADCKANGQPAVVRVAVAELQSYMARTAQERTYGMVLAPFMSDRSAKLCRDAGMGYLDLIGNCEISFDSAFIRLSSAETPRQSRRQVRSVFTHRATEVLQILLTPPRRPWKVKELVAASGVSLGHVSNVRRHLLEHEWATATPDGLVVTQAEALLAAWRDFARQRTREWAEFYTPLHGARLEEALRQALHLAGDGRHALLSSYSAARWLAPFVRQASSFLCVDAAGLEVIERALELKPSGEGGNVFVRIEPDEAPFRRRIEPAPGIWCTGLLQTWLDLSVSGERGREAAEHLLQQTWRHAWEKGE